MLVNEEQCEKVVDVRSKSDNSCGGSVSVWKASDMSNISVWTTSREAT